MGVQRPAHQLAHGTDFHQLIALGGADELILEQRRLGIETPDADHAHIGLTGDLEHRLDQILPLQRLLLLDAGRHHGRRQQEAISANLVRQQHHAVIAVGGAIQRHIADQ